MRSLTQITVIFLILAIIALAVFKISTIDGAGKDGAGKVISLQMTGGNGSTPETSAIVTFDPLSGDTFLVDASTLTSDEFQSVNISMKSSQPASKCKGKLIKFLFKTIIDDQVFSDVGVNINLTFDISMGKYLSDATTVGVDAGPFQGSRDLQVMPLQIVSDGNQFVALSWDSWTVPCFLGEGLVTMQDLTFKRVDEIRKGDKVLGGIIKCMIKSDTPYGTDIVRLGNTGGGWTPHHPVRVNNKVYLPHELGEANHESCDAVYNFIMEEGETMVVGGIETYAIGCDQTDFPVKSSFFAKKEQGVRNIMDYYETLDEYRAGYIYSKYKTSSINEFKMLQIVAQ
jgi:hypothetical protein